MSATTPAAPTQSVAAQPVTDVEVERAVEDNGPQSQEVSAVYDDPPSSANLLEQRLQAARTWLSSANRSHFTIQLLATDVSQGDSLEAFLRGWRSSGRLERIYIYRTRIKGNDWFGVLYDDYETYSQARAALEQLPAEVKRYKPFIRNVRDISQLG